MCAPFFHRWTKWKYHEEATTQFESDGWTDERIYYKDTIRTRECEKCGRRKRRLDQRKEIRREIL